MVEQFKATWLSGLNLIYGNFYASYYDLFMLYIDYSDFDY